MKARAEERVGPLKKDASTKNEPNGSFSCNPLSGVLQKLYSFLEMA